MIEKDHGVINRELDFIDGVGAVIGGGSANIGGTHGYKPTWPTPGP